MLNKIYLIAGGVLLTGYLTWSALGWETGSSRTERVPTVRSYSGGTSGYYGRSRSGYYGSGFGFGK